MQVVYSSHFTVSALNTIARWTLCVLFVLHQIRMKCEISMRDLQILKSNKLVNINSLLWYYVND